MTLFFILGDTSVFKVHNKNKIKMLRALFAALKIILSKWIVINPPYFGI